MIGMQRRTTLGIVDRRDREIDVVILIDDDERRGVTHSVERYRQRSDAHQGDSRISCPHHVRTAVGPER